MENIIYENELGLWHEDGTIELKIDFKNFDISFEDYFYKKNHPEDENAELIEKFYEKVYEKVAELCSSSSVYSIYCFNNRYFVTTRDGFEQLRYNSLTDEEKATEDEEKKQNAIRDKRAERDNLLVTVIDPIVTNPLRWAELSTDEQEAYKQYRLYLLDIPQQESFPNIEIMSLEDFKKTLETSD